MFAEDRVRGERGGGRVPKGGGGRAQRLLQFYEQQVRQVGSVSRRFELNHAACCGSHSSAPPPPRPTPPQKAFQNFPDCRFLLLSPPFSVKIFFLWADQPIKKYILTGLGLSSVGGVGAGQILSPSQEETGPVKF